MRRSLLVALTLALVAASCRGGDDDGPLSKDDYAERANEICAQSNARAAALPPPSLADPVAVEQSVAQVIAIQRDALADLRNLDPPVADEPGVEDWLAVIGRTLDQMERVRRGLREGDQVAIDDANAEAIVLSSEAEEFALQYGILECTTEADEDPR